MSNYYQEVQITDGGVKNGYFPIRRDWGLFPEDSWGGDDASSKAIPVEISFEGTNESVTTDINSKHSMLRFARGQLTRFYKYHGLTGGKTIRVVRIGDRSYRVCFCPESNVAPPEVPCERVGPTDRTVVEVSRIIRDTKITKHVKLIYRYKCQVCRSTIKTKRGLYAEGAHIRPLGSPHYGPDIDSNVLCLCPNHHVMLDYRVFTINDDFTLVGIEGRLFVDAGHKIDPAFLAYHRETQPFVQVP